MSTIYISYKSEEKKLAKSFAKELKSLGLTPVYDIDILKEGEDWRKKLTESLVAADAVMVLLTDAALKSHYVLGEIGAARALMHLDGRKRLFPIFIGGASSIPPVVSDLYVSSMSGTSSSEVKIVAQRIAKSIAARPDTFPRLFISHRHKDAEVTKALVKVIRGAFVIKETDIRCSSLHPYRLPAGENVPAKLRSELMRAEAVLGVISPDTHESIYTMFELGAAWGRESRIFPLLAHGATLGDLPPPIDNLHPLSLSSKRDCFQMIQDLTKVVSLESRSGDNGEVAELVDLLVAAAKAAETPKPVAKTPPKAVPKAKRPASKKARPKIMK